MASLHAAAAGDDLASLQRLLAAGDDPDALDAAGWSPLHCAAQNASEWRIISRLAVAGADVHRRIGDDPDRPTPLHLAALSGNIPALRLLIVLIAGDRKRETPCLDPTYVLESSLPIGGVTPLLLAAWANRAEAATELLRAGAAASATDSFGCGFFHYAAAGDPAPCPGMAAAATAAAALGADVRGRLGCEFGVCASLPIHFAAYFRNKDILEVLLRCGADATARDNRGATPLKLFCCGSGDAPRPIRSPMEAAMVVRLVAAGDRCWGALPARCRGLEAALPAVAAAAPEELPQLFRRLTWGAQRRVQAALRGLHRHLPAPGYGLLRAAILKAALEGSGDEGAEGCESQIEH